MRDNQREEFAKPTDELRARERSDEPIFTVGEKMMVKGVEFTIRKITKKDILIRPSNWKDMPRHEPIERAYQDKSFDG